MTSINPKIRMKIKKSLKQFAYCESCKTPLTGFIVKQKGIHYYKCRTKNCSCNKSATQLHSHFEGELSNYQVDGKYNDLIKDVMIYTYDKITREVRDNSAQTKKQITELQKKLNAVEERFALGEIDKEIFNKFSIKYSTEIDQLNLQIQNPEISSSNLQKAIDNALKLSSNLSSLWSSGDLEEKKKIQKLVFPTGIGYDKQNDKVQTTRVNSIISSIPELTRNIEKTKNGETINLDRFSAIVTLPGFKPGTS